MIRNILTISACALLGALWTGPLAAYDPVPDPRLNPGTYSRDELERSSPRTEWRRAQVKDRAYQSDREILRASRVKEAREKAAAESEEE